MPTAFARTLVHFDATSAAVHRLAYARELLAPHESAVTALYAEDTPLVDLPPYAGFAPEVVGALQQAAERRRDSARAAFDLASGAPGAPVAWAEVTGWPALDPFLRQALVADLLVLGQHDPAGGPALPADFVTQVLVESGKPAIVVPWAGEWSGRCRRIAIAWKDSRESSRAVAAALPLLRRAEQVLVLTWGEAGQPPVEGAVLDLAGWLGAHGVRFDVQRQPDEPAGVVGDLVLSRACDLGAELLVMGCYGHSRPREWVLGGASRTVLRSMTLPVFMVH